MDVLRGTPAPLGSGFFRLATRPPVAYTHDDTTEYGDPVLPPMAGDKPLKLRLLADAGFPFPVPTVLPIELLGIHIIMPRLGIALDEGGGAVHEVNTTPALDDRVLTSNPEERPNPGVPVIGHLLDGASPRVQRR